MRVEVILDSGYIEVKAWVEVTPDDDIILDLHYDGQQVRADKLHPELARHIFEVANDEWNARGE